MANFDKFYTKPDVAKKCVDFLRKHVNIDNHICLEPSAGAGVFLPLLPKYEAYDLMPESENIVKQDFFKLEPQYDNYVTIGNPPFGTRSKMAIDFFNHAARFSNVIAFIVPVSFMKWNVQKELNSNFALIDYFYLEPNSFMDRDKEFSVRCVFQVWIKKELTHLPDLRLKKSPPISHPDFKIWQYNATEQALKTVEEDWEIATYRQGYHDYNKLFYRNDYEYIKRCMTGEETGKKQQFFFIKPITEGAKTIIYNMDFNALAERNTSTPGFGKGDFVSYYEELKSQK
jgi:hypothetical protein